MLTNKLNQFSIIVLSLLFIGLNVCAVWRGEWWAMALPVGLAAAYLALFHLDVFILLIVLATPLSLQLEELGLGLGISLPSEPMLALALVVFATRQLKGGTLPKSFWYHPITCLLIFQLVWMLITSVSSTIPDVSFKFLAARLWFVGVMFFGTIMLYQSKLNHIRSVVLLYTLPLAFVVVYATLRLINMGMDKEMAHFSMQPFFKDHAVYGACIAMFIPLVAGFTFFRKYTPTFRFLNGVLLAILLMGLVYSYSRAAYVSVAAALGMFVVLRFRIDFRYVLTALVLVLGIFISQYDQIMLNMERNKTDSSDDLAEHVESISNISTDASNLERINRWNSAIRMFEEKPLFGWGPGTYSFQYAPFQHSEDLTIISTNAGWLGNAHSEYLGPLAESGLFGMLMAILIVVMIFWRGLSMYSRITDAEVRMLMTGAFLGIITYFVHGVLNNYLDQDKAAVPLYALLGMLVAIDLFHTPATSNKMNKKT